MRRMKLLCAHKINAELARLSDKELLDKRVFVLSRDAVLPRANNSPKKRGKYHKKLAEYGREATRKFLEKNGYKNKI
jgi:hypothetical protein